MTLSSLRILPEVELLPEIRDLLGEYPFLAHRDPRNRAPGLADAPRRRGARVRGGNGAGGPHRRGRGPLLSAEIGRKPARLASPSSAVFPTELKIRPQWVNWRYVLQRGMDQDPITLDPARRRRVQTSSRGAPSSSVYDAYKAGDYDGIGFVLCSGDPLTGITSTVTGTRKAGRWEPGRGRSG